MIPLYGWIDMRLARTPPPVGAISSMAFVDEFMREWLFVSRELHAGEITRRVF